MDVILELNDSVIFPNISCSQNFIICTFLFFCVCVIISFSFLQLDWNECNSTHLHVLPFIPRDFK